ncbi:MAG: tetratricopeptide repeat protein [Myxococcales bacterium]|nr:tetratricopeptide repeat protein [Myxococcales bacterium]
MANDGHSSQGLRQRVEEALTAGARGTSVLMQLERLVQSAEDGSADALFAHRQLAELRLERSPWRAALHLRQLIQHGGADDGVHALMGLCQALLGNFHAAARAYERALEDCEDNPWYRHNLGHLLDVGADRPEAAIGHLRLAHELEPDEDEITASLAHCLARLGELDEARSLALHALRAAPDSAEHKLLVDWIDRGAPGQDSPGTLLRQSAMDKRSEPSESVSGDDPVVRLLWQRMGEASYSRQEIRRAVALWLDFRGERELRGTKPEVHAAAVEYTIAKLDGLQNLTQGRIARRYGVAPGSISQRYGEIRTTLALVPSDPRY